MGQSETRRSRSDRVVLGLRVLGYKFYVLSSKFEKRHCGRGSCGLSRSRFSNSNFQLKTYNLKPITYN
jgi:hypothetical protein